MSEKIIFIFLLFTCVKSPPNTKYAYRCKGNEKVIPKKVKEVPFRQKKTLYKMRLIDDYDENINIVIEYKNIETEMTLYNLLSYRETLFNAMKTAADILNSLLKPTYRGCYYFEEDFVQAFGYYYWDKEKFGINKTRKYFYTCDYNIDFLIFFRFINKTEEQENKNVDLFFDTLYVKSIGGQPIIGEVILNKTILSKTINSLEYWKNYFLLSFTQILGFNHYHITNYFHNMLTKYDKYGIKRKYINSSKVIQAAKKYFNCNDIDGVELEESTTTIYWESRILLGEYMCRYGYEPERFISEITLAFLEDTGYYTVNYYTGGRMQYGRNKGC